MKKHDYDLLACRVMIVAQNLSETRSLVSRASPDSIKVTAMDIANITGESLERIGVALRQLEAWGLMEEVNMDGRFYIRTNQEGLNDSAGVEIEISPKSKAIIEWVAEREGLTPEEAFYNMLKLRFETEGLDIDEGLNKG